MRNKLAAISMVIAYASLATASTSAHAEQAYVVLGEQGRPQVRIVTEQTMCPSLQVDGLSVTTRLRADAGTIAQRETKSSVQDSKPSAFPVRVCEAELPASARDISLAGKHLPAPAPRYARIVVLGDTGCRLKRADDAYQACNDADAFPFARVAAQAATWKPDLVIHVGDYHYRENKCPDGMAGCAGSPWGYGWDAWDADFFTPARPLLEAAPWVMVRGNHESCARGGQGWWRFLDPHPLLAHRDCNLANDDAIGDNSPPYAVALGDGAQVLVLDSSAASNSALEAGDARRKQFAEAFSALDALARGASFNILANHHPILGFASKEGHGGETKLLPGNASLQSSFADLSKRYAPENTKMMLAGHVHLWEQVSFSSDHPSQFISGFSGTQEDPVPIPASVPKSATPAPGAVVEAVSSWVNGFGYMTLERADKDAWTVKVWSVSGQLMNTCEVLGRQSHCSRPQVQ